MTASTPPLDLDMDTLHEWVQEGLAAASRVVPSMLNQRVRSRLLFGSAFANGVCAGVDEAELVIFQASHPQVEDLASSLFIARVNDQWVGDGHCLSLDQIHRLLLVDFQDSLDKANLGASATGIRIKQISTSPQKRQEMPAGPAAKAIADTISRRYQAYRQANELERSSPLAASSPPGRGPRL